MKKQLMTLAMTAAMLTTSAVNPADSVRHSLRDHLQLNHLSVGVELGTTGLGLEVATPVNTWMRVRAGVSFTPHVSIPMSFGLSNYGGSASFSSLQSVMKSFTGYEVDEKVKVDGKPSMTDFRFMLDFYPIKSDRRWRVTAGFLWGSKCVATATNTIEDMTTTLGVGIYNRMYQSIISTNFIDTPIYDNVYLDPELAMKMQNRFRSYGFMGVKAGEYADGSDCILEPDTDGVMRAKMYVNSFKPFIGVGFQLPFSSDRRWGFEAELGMLMWGGTPSVRSRALVLDSDGQPVVDANGEWTYRSVDLTHDVQNLRGNIGKYCDLVSAFKVYPTLSVKLTFQAI